MYRKIGLTLGFIALTSVPAPERLVAQDVRPPSENVWTRSAALYINRARGQSRPEERASLWQQALEAALNGVDHDAANARSWLQGGQAAWQLGQFAKADSMLTRALQLFPGYEEEVARERSNAWTTAYNAGVSALNAGDMERAHASLTAAVTMDDRRADAFLSLGLIHTRSNEIDEAIRMYERAVESVEANAPRQQEAGARPQRGQPTPAQQRQRWEENRRVAYFNLGQLYAQTERFEEGERIYRRYLEIDPDNQMAQTNLAVILTRTGQTDEAADVYTNLMRQGADLTTQDYMNIAVGLSSAGRFDEASEAFARARERNPYMRDIYFNELQVTYSRTLPLEEMFQTSEADRPTIAEELKKLYGAIVELSNRVLTFDPHNRSTVLLKARAHRMMADLTEDHEEYDRLADLARELVDQAESLPFEVRDVRLRMQEANGVLTGTLENSTLEPGQTVTLRFHMLNRSGDTVTTQEVSVTAPQRDSSVSFQLQVLGAEGVTGWRYEVTN